MPVAQRDVGTVYRHVPMQCDKPSPDPMCQRRSVSGVGLLVPEGGRPPGGGRGCHSIHVAAEDRACTKAHSGMDGAILADLNKPLKARRMATHCAVASCWWLSLRDDAPPALNTSVHNGVVRLNGATTYLQCSACSVCHLKEPFDSPRFFGGRGVPASAAIVSLWLDMGEACQMPGALVSTWHSLETALHGTA